MESRTARVRRTRRIANRLRTIFPDASCNLTYAEPWQLLVKTILSAQCTDERVNEVGVHLFAKYSSMKDFESVPIAELEQDIRPTGFFRSKARHIQQTARILREEFQSHLPRTMDELRSLPGVGRKTANVILGHVHGIPSIVVDTHVIRISNLLRLTRSRDPDRIEKDLMDVLPKEDWTVWSHWIGEHGRATCVARRPRCGDCVLYDLCPSARSAETGK